MTASSAFISFADWVKEKLTTSPSVGFANIGVDARDKPTAPWLSIEQGPVNSFGAWQDAVIVNLRVFLAAADSEQMTVTENTYIGGLVRRLGSTGAISRYDYSSGSKVMDGIVHYRKVSETPNLLDDPLKCERIITYELYTTIKGDTQ